MNQFSRFIAALLSAGIGTAAALHFFPLHGAAFATAIAATGLIAAAALLLGPAVPTVGKSENESSNGWNPLPAWLAPLGGFFVAFALAGVLLAAGRVLAQQTDDYMPEQLRALITAIGAGLAGAVASRVRVGSLAGRLSSAAWMLAAAVLLTGPLLLRVHAFGVLPVAFFAGFALALCAAAGARPVVAVAVVAGLFAGVFGTGFALFPRLHYAGSLYAAAVWPVLLFAAAVVVTRQSLVKLAVGLVVLGAGALALPGRLAPILSPGEGWTVAAQREGVAGAVTLLEKPVPAGQPLLQRLIVDNRHVLGGELGFGEKRLGHLPLLLKPDAKSALFVGVGAGVVMGAAKSYTGLERIDGFESSPDVVALLPQFATSNDQLTEEPRVKIVVGAPQALLSAASQQYDVIVAGPNPPDREGAAWLLARPIFSAAKRHLHPGGVFAVWLPLTRLGAEDLRLVVRTYLNVFPQARGFIGIYNGELPVFGLLARADGPLPAAEEVQKLLANNGRAHAFVNDAADLLASELLDAGALRTFAGEGALNEGRFPPLLAGHASRGTPRGGELLKVLLATATPPAGTAWLSGAVPADDVLAHRMKAVRNYLAGDILRVGGDAQKEREMLDQFLASFRADPAWPLTRSMLLLLSLQKPHLAKAIFEAMVESAPDDVQLRKLFFQMQRKNAEARGLPVPPAPRAGAPALPPLPPMPGLPPDAPKPRLPESP